MRGTQGRATRRGGSGRAAAWSRRTGGAAALAVAGAFALFLAFASPCFGCTTILVGKDASETGSCLMAHNENDDPFDCTVVGVVPAATHEPGSRYRLFYGGTVPLPVETLGYIATRVYDKSLIPGDVTDLLNDHQVTIANNWAPGRYEPKGHNILWSELTELVGMQATSARDAVQIMGALVEGYGVKWGGTMYAIADPDEAWWIEICGKQWVARRVGDDRAVMRANCYRIGAVDFTDVSHSRFMWSDDVRSFARKRGWWRPADGAFSWKRAYHWPGETEWAADNTVRHLMTARYLRKYMAGAGKVSRRQLMSILRSHYEGTRWYNHKLRPYTICNQYNIASCVSELRRDLPAGIGGVLWTCLSEPCSNGFFPIYQGVTAMPAEWTYGSYRWAPGSAYWACRSRRRWVYDRFDPRHRAVTRRWRAFERGEFAAQAGVEAEALEAYENGGPGAAAAVLTAYTAQQAAAVYKLTLDLPR